MIINLKDSDKKAYNLIRNKILTEGQGPTLKEINAITGGKSPRSASIVLDRLERIGLIKKTGNKLRLTPNPEINPSSVETVEIPLVGTVTCGMPMFAEENIEGYIPISTNLAKKNSRYFLLRAAGTSMNLAGINDKDILLIRQQNTANDGESVVILINDSATVKAFYKSKNAIILRPKSTDSKHKPIVLTENCQIQGVVVAVLPPDLI